MANLHYIVQVALLLNYFDSVYSSVNLALQRPTNQSSTSYEAPSGRAVDGNKNTNWKGGSCVHTKEGETTAWWQVDLGKSSEITQIDIYYRKEVLQRLNGYILKISDTNNFENATLCHQDNINIVPHSDVQKQICRYVGRYVQFSVERPPGTASYSNQGAVINLCEMEVYGCEVGKYGNGQCDKFCSEGCSNSSCNPDDGKCNCKDGWAGPTCQEIESCETSYFGTNCDIPCPANCLESKCHKSNGTCTRGCNNGFYGVNCSHHCPKNCAWKYCSKTGHCTKGCNDGFYGATCSMTCSQNCKSNKCNVSDGDCTNGCRDDVTHGFDCTTKCPSNCKAGTCRKEDGNCFNCTDGFYGNTCKDQCSDKCKDLLCHRNGTCLNCMLGYYGINCNSKCSTGCKDKLCDRSDGTCACQNNNIVGEKCAACLNGHYGTYCEKICPIDCNDTRCNRTTGDCLSGCKALREGPKCEDCQNRKYGEDCTKNCPRNCNGDVCDRITGKCPKGCIGNFGGMQCNDCKNGFYGMNCSQTCFHSCAENKCMKNNGSCYSCNNWFSLPNCSKCVKGRYGRDCSLECHCLNSDCNMDNGTCFDKCEHGWSGPACNKEVEQTGQTPSDNTAPISGGVVAVVVVVIVIIIVIVMRRRKQKSGKEKTYFSNLKGSSKNVKDNPYDITSNQDQDLEEQGLNTNIQTTSMNDVYENTPVYGNLRSTEVPVTELSTLISKKSAGKEFEKEYAKLKSGAVHPCTVGQDPDNKIKNRFLTTFPYDHSRVVLETLTGQPKSDYINANYIDGVEERFLYVATQGPKPNTVSDFWRLIWQIESGKIVMLTNLKEGTKVKCDKYWPDLSQTKDVGTLKVTSQVEKEFAFYIERSLLLYNKKTKKTRKIKQFHFTMWPDHGTPDPVQLMLFHRKIRNAESSMTGPYVVHCSAGIGRTGTFIALDALHEYGDRTGKIDIFEYVIRMRKDRMNMIQTVEQYIVLHEALLESFQYTGGSMTRDQFLQICNEMQNGKPKNQTHIYKEYQSLSSLRPVYGVESYESALEKENKRKSRNFNILAVEKYRPYLISFHSSRTNFINAVILPSCSQRCGYLVTHYPLKDTVVDLWCMIFDHESTTVAVLDENGDKDGKSTWYPRDNEEMNIGVFAVTKISGPHTYSNIQEMEFSVKHKNKDEERNVAVFLLRPWPTGNCLPPDKTELLKQLELVDNHQQAKHGPVTVICSDGAQCCGLFCTVSNAIQNLRIDEEIDVFHTVRQFHIRRPQFFETFEDYQSCYEMIKTYLESSNVYANSSAM